IIQSLVFIVFLLNFSHAEAQTKEYIDSLIRAADTEEADSARIDVYNKLGNYYMDNNVVKAITWLEKSKELAIKTENRLLEANNHYSIGYSHLINANFDKSLFHYLE